MIHVDELEPIAPRQVLCGFELGPALIGRDGYLRVRHRDLLIGCG
jgi:hypothetical protein